MRIIALLPLVMFLLSITVLVFFIYAIVSIVKSNQSQAEALKEIERTLKRIADSEK